MNFKEVIENNFDLIQKVFDINKYKFDMGGLRLNHRIVAIKEIFEYDRKLTAEDIDGLVINTKGISFDFMIEDTPSCFFPSLSATWEELNNEDWIDKFKEKTLLDYEDKLKEHNVELKLTYKKIVNLQRTIDKMEGK